MTSTEHYMAQMDKTRAGIFIAIDGKPVDLAEISWYEKPPCGCTACGATIAYGNRPPLVVATAEQAAEEFWDTKHEREKYERLGFTVFPDLLSKCRELLVTTCPHEPRFGVPPRPAVEGYEWAAVSALGSRPKLMHLVPTTAIEDAREQRYGSENGKPLCGGKAAFWWKTEWHALDGKVECSRCMKKAATS